MTTNTLREYPKLTTAVLFAFGDSVIKVATLVSEQETKRTNDIKALAHARANPEASYVLRDAMIDEAPALILKFILHELAAEARLCTQELLESALPESLTKMTRRRFVELCEDLTPALSSRVQNREGMERFLSAAFKLTCLNATRKAYPKKSIIHACSDTDVHCVRHLEQAPSDEESPFPDFRALVADCAQEIQQRVELYLTEPDWSVAEIAAHMHLSVDKVKKLNAKVKNILRILLAESGGAEAYF